MADFVRPRKPCQIDEASTKLQNLTDFFRLWPEHAASVSESFFRLLRERKQVSLYISSGLLPPTGFFSEIARRLSHKILPDVIDCNYLKDALSVIFPRKSDEIWVNGIDDAVWIAFLTAMLAAAPATPEAHQEDLATIEELVEALRVLSFRVSSMGLDPEILRLDPDLEKYESPFLAQNAELLIYLDNFQKWWLDPTLPLIDEKQLTVMLDQCTEVLQRIRRRSAKLGTSLRLTFTLERLHQHLDRIHELLNLLDTLRIVEDTCTEEDTRAIFPKAVPFFKSLVYAECRKTNIVDYWRQNVELLALRMTENASRTGEHYITETVKEYAAMWWSAALGGMIIAFMSANKIFMSSQNMAPMVEGLCFCLNYGIGFVLIHVLGGTVATKQPAMTANAIAASIGEASGKTRDLENLAVMIACTVRSQMAAILGNVGVAIPVAILLGLAITHLTGNPFVTPEKANHLLAEVDPLSGAPLYAAIAGVWLFLAGLIAGFYDNVSAYNRIPERLRQLEWPRRLFGDKRAEKIAAYFEDNMGALAGNFFFGFMLGGTTALGVMLGLPLDIRHIAFSSAFVGYAVTGLGFDIPLGLLIQSLCGVFLIGFMNLAVSFTLTLNIALRSRHINFDQRKSLALLVLKHFIHRPKDFFFPPLQSNPPRNS